MNCRFCQAELTNVFVDLQSSPPSNNFLTYQQLNEKEIYFPLVVFTCDKCFLVQLDEYKKANEIFSREYVYYSSFSSTWLKHCERYAYSVINRFGLNEKSFVTEIASNDGTLLTAWKGQGFDVLGVDPARNIADKANQRGITTQRSVI